MNFRCFLLLGFLLGASAPSVAGVSSAQLEKVVSSLSVSGTIEVDPQGRVPLEQPLQLLTPLNAG